MLGIVRFGGFASGGVEDEADGGGAEVVGFEASADFGGGFSFVLVQELEPLMDVFAGAFFEAGEHGGPVGEAGVE